MKNFTYLANVGVEQLFEAIQREHMQTIAIVLIHVEADVAADVLNMFSKDMKADIVIRMSELDTVPDMFIKSISDTLKGKMIPKGIKLGGIKAVADILKHLDKK